MRKLFCLLAGCSMVGISVILSLSHLTISTWQWWAIIVLVAFYGMFEIAAFDNDNDNED